MVDPAVFNGAKGLIGGFIEALRNEIKGADGVIVTSAMPGRVDTEFFTRGQGSTRWSGPILTSATPSQRMGGTRA